MVRGCLRRQIAGPDWPMVLEVRCWGGTVSAGSPGASRSNPKVPARVSPREVREHPPLGRRRCFAREQQGRGRRELLGGLLIRGWW